MPSTRTPPTVDHPAKELRLCAPRAQPAGTGPIRRWLGLLTHNPCPEGPRQRARLATPAGTVPPGATEEVGSGYLRPATENHVPACSPRQSPHDIERPASATLMRPRRRWSDRTATLPGWVRSSQPYVVLDHRLVYILGCIHLYATVSTAVLDCVSAPYAGPLSVTKWVLSGTMKPPVLLTPQSIHVSFENHTHGPPNVSRWNGGGRIHGFWVY